MTDTTTGLVLAVERAGKTTSKITVNLDGVAVSVDTVNLSNTTARGEFIAALADRVLAVYVDVIDAELVRLAAAGNTSAPTGGESAPEGPGNPLAEMPQDVIDDANAVLVDTELMERVCDAAAVVGVAGERALLATIDLLGVSRLLPRPLAAIIRGSSSSGKSYAVGKVASLFPPEALVRATQDWHRNKCRVLAVALIAALRRSAAPGCARQASRPWALLLNAFGVPEPNPATR